MPSFRNYYNNDFMVWGTIKNYPQTLEKLYFK
ncbi:hypothetical protein LIBO111022_00090 [Listeria booriae]|nr:Uncharacterised protein [Listeria booriae]